jgi:hypothetical protein
MIRPMSDAARTPTSRAYAAIQELIFLGAGNPDHSPSIGSTEELRPAGDIAESLVGVGEADAGQAAQPHSHSGGKASSTSGASNEPGKVSGLLPFHCKAAPQGIFLALAIDVE